MMVVREYGQADVAAMVDVWNEVVRDGIAFPQEDELDLASGAGFFSSQTYCGVAVEDGRLLGLYILHPNNVGRCGHIANASYAVSSAARGQGRRTGTGRGLLGAGPGARLPRDAVQCRRRLERRRPPPL